MRSIKLAVLLLGLAFLAIGLTSVPDAHAGPAINTAWTNSPPTLDGKFTQGEWHNLQISMNPPDYPIEAYAYLMNDNSYLYVLVDAVGDTVASNGDECLMWFGFKDISPWHIVDVSVYGDGHKSPASGFDAVVGLFGSPNSATPHRTYEFRIPLSLIGIQPGQSIEFSSPQWKGYSIVYDPDTIGPNDNIWPSGLVVGTRSTYGTLGVQKSTIQPVGGLVVPANKLAIFAPYVVLGLTALAVVLVASEKRRDN